MVSLQKIVVERKTIHDSVITKDAPVMIAGEKIGKCFSLRASEDGSDVSAYFRLNTGRLLADCEVYVALPEIRPKTIGCAICGRFYGARDVSCPCLYRSPVLVLREISIIGVHLLDTRIENINGSDMRSQLLLRHFGGALGGMDLED